MDKNIKEQLQETQSQRAFIGDESSSIQDVTGFVDAGEVVALSGDEVNFSSPFDKSMADPDSKSIFDILSRWHYFGVYAQESAYTKQLSDIINSMPTLDKLRGFVGFNGTINIKLTWNTDPTIQGLFVLAYVPPGVNYPQTTGYAGLATFLTGCNHVIMNIAESSAAVLSIPYTGEYNVIPLLKTASYDRKVLGSIMIHPIVTIASAISPSAIQMSMFLSLTDISTYGVSLATPQVQGKRVFSYSPKPKKICQTTPILPVHQVRRYARVPLVQTDDVITTPISVKCVGTKPELHASAAVVEAMRKSKVVSSTAGNISKWLNAHAGDGIVGSITRGLGWATGAASKIADFLGFSKPMDMQTTTPVVQLPYKDLCSADQTFTGAKFTQNVDQQIGPIDLSGRGVDEMLISEFVSRPNYFPAVHNTQATDGDIILDKTYPEGTLIGTLNVSPTFFRYAATIGGTLYRDSVQTQMSYLSRNFAYWRGTMVLTIRAVCTKFHSARVRVVFVPGDMVATDLVNLNMPYTYAHVLDIRDASTFTLEIPFIYPKPWAKMGPGFAQAVQTGVLYFIVENPLVAPDNVSNTIKLCTFISGGKDFEVASPGNMSQEKPWQLATTAIPTVQSRPLGDLMSVAAHSLTPVSLAPQTTTSSVEAHALAVGDPIRSLRAVLKRFWSSGVVLPPSSGDFDVVLTCEPTVLNTPATSTDIITRFAWCYTLHRGGMRWYAQNYYPSRVTQLLSATSDYLVQNGIGTSQTTNTTTSQSVGIGITEPMKMEIPYYTDTVCENHWIPGNYSEAALLVQYYLGGTGASFQRALADDASFGLLVGAPILLPLAT